MDSRRMAGYSGTPLPKKLGIKAGSRLAAVDPPDGFLDSLGPLPEGAAVVPESNRPLDLVVLFAPSKAVLDARFAALAARLTPTGMLWVAWPKRASGRPTDLTEDVVRGVGLGIGVDTKVCAIDEVWSGLKFVIRKKDRPSP